VRQNNPSRQILEKGFALLEDSKYSLCFSSGTSAISAVVQLLNTGEHIVSSEVIFGGTYRYFDRVRFLSGPLITIAFICFIRLDRLTTGQWLTTICQSSTF
jgi:cystathionine beta-lyase/cystathionine gamma-synthase